MAVPCNALPIAPATAGASLLVSLAAGDDDIRACQALRYRVFAEELGARLQSAHPGLDVDAFDDYCMHLLVRDSATVRVYLDGQLEIETTAADSALPATVDRFFFAGRSDNAANWEGRLDEIAVFDRALSPAEITALGIP